MFILIRRVIHWDEGAGGERPEAGWLMSFAPENCLPNHYVGARGDFRFMPSGAKKDCVCEGALFSDEQVELLNELFELLPRERAKCVGSVATNLAREELFLEANIDRDEEKQLRKQQDERRAILTERFFPKPSEPFEKVAKETEEQYPREWLARPWKGES